MVLTTTNLIGERPVRTYLAAHAVLAIDFNCVVLDKAGSMLMVAASGTAVELG